jgi:signal peptidase I
VTAQPPEGQPPRRSSGRRLIFEYLVIFVIAVAIAFALQAFVVKPYRIPSPSMVPTLDPGDRVLVARFWYRATAPQRGDIVVFKWPPAAFIKERGGWSGPRFVFIKRLIGLPGDVLSLRDGYVYVNGVRLNEPYVAKQADGRPAPTQPGTPLAGSTLARPWSLERPYTVPSGSYFMMGDNRQNSDDSRDWGPITMTDVIGKAFFVYWPLSRVGLP